MIEDKEPKVIRVPLLLLLLLLLMFTDERKLVQKRLQKSYGEAGR
jgi:hypothetical protein